jgi:glutamine cyclotransferase
MLLYLDDEFAVERQVEANDTKRRGEMLTELEWIYDKIWANAEKDDTVRAYDAETGYIVYSLDIAALNLDSNVNW